jgi:uncharacterized protein YecE (DUF72 family)
MLPLFDEPTGFDREGLASSLRRLANENIYIGGSSWRYEGWLGLVYTPDRYLVRGKFSRKRFEEKCIAEYSETFPIVCGDFSFYQFPPEEFWQKLFSSAPSSLQFGFKVPEEITCKTFPNHPRYGPRAAQPNPGFLDTALFESAFLQPLQPYRNRIAVLIFEFGTFSKKAYSEPREFFRDLDIFLRKLPEGFRYAVEVRNDDYLQPEYFAVLRERSVAHVFNAWNRMPPIHRQMLNPEAFTADFTVVRALLRAGRSYEQAVKMFAPYDRIQDENPQTRQAMRDLITRARRKREPAYLFVNNRLEGNAPVTIQSIVGSGGDGQ